jgi:uncharacterized Ntn-hydrolase superfamily protein
MTWSIVARDPETSSFGVAVTTKFFAVGARCPFAASGVGALSTQALVNPFYGPRGMQLLRGGVPAPLVVKELTRGDEGRDYRQLHMLDAAGRNAAHTGALCIDWCGHVLREGFSVAGNMLAGPAVIEDTASAYEKHAALPFAERLIAALDAGQAAGGDKRGRQSAALLIYGKEEYSDLDIRVDDHAEPLAELRRLYEEAKRMWIPFRQFLPTRARPAGVTDRAVINAELERLRAASESLLPDGEKEGPARSAGG